MTSKELVLRIKTDREGLVAEMVEDMGISPYAARRLINNVTIIKTGRTIGYRGVSGKLIGKTTKETR